MGSSFYNVTARMGLDITPMQKSLATAQVEIASFKSGLSKILKAGGERGLAKFLGVGAAVYALKEVFAAAKERGEELQKQQNESIDRAYAYYEITKKSTNNVEAIAKAWERTQKAVENATSSMPQNERDAALVRSPSGISGAFGDAANHLIAGIYKLYGGFTDAYESLFSNKGVGQIGHETEQFNRYLEEEAGVSYSNQKQAELHQKSVEELNTAKAKQSVISAKLSADKQKELEASDPATWLEFYEKSLPALKGKIFGNDYANNPSGQNEKTADMETEIHYLDKIAELKKLIDELDAKADEKAAKAAGLAQKRQDLEQKSMDIARRELPISEEIENNKREAFEIEQEIQDTSSVTQKEKYNELLDKRNANWARGNELQNKQNQLLDELALLLPVLGHYFLLMEIFFLPGPQLPVEYWQLQP